MHIPSFFYLKGRETKRQSSHLLVHSLDAQNGQAWAGLRLGARNSIQRQGPDSLEHHITSQGLLWQEAGVRAGTKNGAQALGYRIWVS